MRRVWTAADPHLALGPTPLPGRDHRLPGEDPPARPPHAPLLPARPPPRRGRLREGRAHAARHELPARAQALPAPDRLPLGEVVLAEQVLDAPDLVVEGLLRAVPALVELQDGVDARHALVERHRVELADHREDVLGRALERGAHRVHPEANAILPRQAALDLGDVLARARALPTEREHGQVGGGHAAADPIALLLTFGAALAAAGLGAGVGARRAGILLRLVRRLLCGILLWGLHPAPVPIARPSHSRRPRPSATERRSSGAAR